MSRYVLGIDLGTVNSCVAVVQDGRAVVLPDDSGNTIPSCLAIQKGKEIVGRPAKRHAVTEPQTCVSAVKRLMGHAYESTEVEQARARVAYPIRPNPLGGVLIEIGGREFSPVQVSARILQRVREVAERALGESVARAVISVPAHFTDAQRKATKLAGEYAGLEVMRLINEPTAAAFAYGYRTGRDQRLAVYDLGGGTFDITVMAARGDTFEVEATHGDAYLGGEDFDYAIADWLEQQFETRHGYSLRDDQAARLRIKEAAERAKLELSERAQAEIDLPFLTELPDGSRPNFACSLTREKLEELTQQLVERTLESCRRCLEEAGLSTEDIQDVLLVGGQTRMPQVREAVRNLFGREPRRDINPDEVVAVGAALYGYSLIADDLKEEAHGAAEDAYSVALRDTAVARKVLAGVEALGGEPLSPGALAGRLEKLLEEADAELPSLPTRPGGDSDLPGAVHDLRDELLQLERRAGEVIQRVQALPIERAGDVEVRLEEVEGRSEDVERLAERIGERLHAADEASRKAEEHLEEAQQHAQARKVDLVDVTSHALGIAAAADVFTSLIDKNAPIPTHKERVFTTNQDGQTEVEICVFQGASARASLNQFLGSFVLEGLDPAPRMEPQILVRFRIDEDGILSVDARDAVTGQQQGIRVEDPLGLQKRS